MSNIKMDNSRMQNHATHESKANHKDDKNQTVKHGDKEHFEKALSNGKKPHEVYEAYEALDSKDKHSSTKKLSEEDTLTSQMDVLLSGRESMLKQFNTLQNTNDVKELDPKATQDISVEKLTKLAESILVSQTDSKQQEVRITVNNDILAQTEIVLNRDKDGGLLVNLVTDNTTSWQSLVQGQHDLRNLLAKTENNVTVRVQSTAENQAENNDSQRRSRGFMQVNMNEENL